jgi:hypothetical protein
MMAGATNSRCFPDLEGLSRHLEKKYHSGLRRLGDDFL